MWIKIPLEEANQIVHLSDSMLVDGLNLDPTNDVREYLIYSVVDGFVYLFPAFFDLKNKNRINPPSEEESSGWLSFVASKGWVMVDKVPEELL